MPRSQAIQYFNDNADDLSIRYNKINRAKVHADLIKRLPKSRKLQVLDVGAGSGADAGLFASMGHDVMAVEPAKKLRDIASKTFKNMQIKWKSDKLPDLKSVSATGKKFDVIYASNVLQYLDEKNRITALNKMTSLLKNGGFLEIQYPSPASMVYQFSIKPKEIKNFVSQFNEKSRSKLKILQQTRAKDFTGRKALDGSTLYFNTTIITRLKKPARKSGSI